MIWNLASPQGKHFSRHEVLIHAYRQAAEKLTEPRVADATRAQKLCNSVVPPTLELFGSWRQKPHAELS